MQIQKVEEIVGITKKNIRFYEKEGLLNPQRKIDNGYRQYSEEDIKNLERIKLLRKLDVPIEVIRDIFNGKVTYESSMSEHARPLKKQLKAIETAAELTSELCELGNELNDEHTKHFLQKVADMERKGVKFMDIHKKDKAKKYKGALIAAIVASVFFAVTAGIILVDVILQAEHIIFSDILGISFALFMLIVVIVGVWIALVQRFNQIKKGEEDEATKY